ncbi:ABC-F type ribosomal protection protein [Filobacillus milosensis]|uniref:ABC-F type ribosomal protection protein n=2 Tax=Filobacillus milosensis TaxID=94137 RepID=A0A4Y8INH5_9BACI|nr:ABC-F type ribosomal protection protein [Filobacillus milosensis]TFB22891.1 ABC-F type ribosomal protection protein [Filobacillus milosensis]
MICRLTNIKYELAERTLLNIEDLSIHKEDQIGLIGLNGSGKSTLMKMIANETQPTEGVVSSYGTTAYLPQLKPQKDTLSGGEITQEWIQRIFSQDKDLLLLDEPTTHLDQQHIEKLEQKLQQLNKPFLVVSHDRAFLDILCTKIWEIDEEKIKEYSGNYSDYEAQKQEQLLHHEKQYEKYVKKKKQLENALQLKEQKANRATTIPKKVSKSEAKITGSAPYYAKKQKKLYQGAKAIESRIEQLDKVEKIKELPPIKMDLAAPLTAANKHLIRAEQLPGHVGPKHLWKPSTFMVGNGEKIGIIGPNGSGKTTLIRELMTNDEHIQRSPQAKFGYFSQQLEHLDTEKSILRNVKEKSSQDETLIRTVLARLGFFRDDVFKNVAVLSGGERVKVALAKIFVSDVNVLVLDEPTNFLDIAALEALEQLLVEYPGTVLFVSHDRRFVEKVADKLMILHEGNLHVHQGSEQDFWQTLKKADSNEELLKVETQITEVLSRMGFGTSDELEEEFERLVQKKKDLES